MRTCTLYCWYLVVWHSGKNQFMIKLMENCIRSILILCLTMMDALNSLPQPHPMSPIVNGKVFNHFTEDGDGDDDETNISSGTSMRKHEWCWQINFHFYSIFRHDGEKNCIFVLLNIQDRSSFFPYAVSFGYQRDGSYFHFCGGSIIASNSTTSWAISAAHCFMT